MQKLWIKSIGNSRFSHNVIWKTGTLVVVYELWKWNKMRWEKARVLLKKTHLELIHESCNEYFFTKDLYFGQNLIVIGSIKEIVSFWYLFAMTCLRLIAIKFVALVKFCCSCKILLWKNKTREIPVIGVPNTSESIWHLMENGLNQ